MDPQTFLRLSITSLGLRVPVETSKTRASTVNSSTKCFCKIRLRGFPSQTASVPLMTSPDAILDVGTNAAVFYLEESDLKALKLPGCFRTPQSHLEIIVYMGKQGSNCGINSRRYQVGMLRIEVGPEWGHGKPMIIHNGWIKIGKNLEADKQGLELHLIVKLDPDPRYVFQFEDETTLSPQIFQVQGTIKQPIFSCKFSQDRRVSQQQDKLGNYWSSSENDYQVDERRERKGWKVMIHDLSGFAVASAFMATPFVPSMGCHTVARSNPGAWLILRPDQVGSSDSWHPWGRLEAWRETGARDSVRLRFYLLPEGQEAGLLVSETKLRADKGGEFFIDMDRQTPLGTPIRTSQGSKCDYYTVPVGGPIVGGFVMNCKVQGEDNSSKPLVHLAMRHVTCMEDAAILMALAAAADLSIKACKPFRRKSIKRDRLFRSLLT